MTLGDVPTQFTPGPALAGGALIGLAAVLMMLVYGRIAGIAGIVARGLPAWRGDQGAASGAERGRALAFAAGLIAAPVLLAALTGAWPAVQTVAGPGLLVAAGLLVGFGTVLGNGCTSGHGVCGLARLSRRSAVAVAVFMATAVATVGVMRHVL